MAIPIERIRDELEDHEEIKLLFSEGSYDGDTVLLELENTEFDMENSVITKERPRHDQWFIFDANAVWRINNA